tara:strand:+ start:2819 stop:3349 length:531 start_codon:yes stop_codon:yes gene_type:complete
MKKFTSFTDTVYVKDKFITSTICKKYIKLAKNPTPAVRDSYTANNPLWNERIVDVTNDPIVLKVKKFLDVEFNLNLEIARAEIQNWFLGTYGSLHVHDNYDYMGINPRYNSLLYLNDNFKEGFFHTSHGVIIKPEIGRLTFFDGKEIHHGTSEVKKADRLTIIFWWKDQGVIKELK